MKFQLAAPPQSAEEQKKAESEPAPTSVGGLISGFVRRMARKKADDKPADPNAVPGRVTVMTTTTETLQVATTVADGDVALPAGFKLK